MAYMDISVMMFLNIVIVISTYELPNYSCPEDTHLLVFDNILCSNCYLLCNVFVFIMFRLYLVKYCY